MAASTTRRPSLSVEPVTSANWTSWLVVAWGLLVAQLLFILGLLAWQPSQWLWLSWRDLGGGLLLLVGTLLALAPFSSQPMASRMKSGHRYALFAIPLLTWVGLWGQQSITAQAIGAGWLILLGVSLWPSLPPRFRMLERLPQLQTSPLASRLVANHNRANMRTRATRKRLDDAASKTRWQQSWQRTKTETEEDVVGTVTFEFKAGQRTAWSHIPVWPAMGSVPTVEIDELTGPLAGRVKATQIEAYGVRLELRLAQPAPAHTLVPTRFRLHSHTTA